jgi:hypothetical protein
MAEISCLAATLVVAHAKLHHVCLVSFTEWSTKRVGYKKGGQSHQSGAWSTKRVGSQTLG